MGRMTDQEIADSIDHIKSEALRLCNGDVEAAFDALAKLALTQAARLRIDGQRGYGRLPPDQMSGISQKQRTDPL